MVENNRYINRIPQARVILFLCAASVFFVIFPDLDLVVSAAFYDEGAQGFSYGAPMVDMVTHAFSVSWKYVVFAILALMVVRVVFPSKASILPRPVALLYILLVMAIGPGLLVNGIFKEVFGRARPLYVLEFGGDKQFTPALTLSNQCDHNCSFTSGHAAGAFVLIAPALLARRRRTLYVVSAIAVGLLIGLFRVIQGKHFLSDVFFSGLTVALVALGLHYLMLVKYSEHR